MWQEVAVGALVGAVVAVVSSIVGYHIRKREMTDVAKREEEQAKKERAVAALREILQPVHELVSIGLELVSTGQRAAKLESIPKEMAQQLTDELNRYAVEFDRRSLRVGAKVIPPTEKHLMRLMHGFRVLVTRYADALNATPLDIECCDRLAAKITYVASAADAIAVHWREAIHRGEGDIYDLYPQ